MPVTRSEIVRERDRLGMSDYDSVMVINEGLTSKTTASGKTKFSIRIESEPVFVNVSPKDLGAPVANAIAHHLREKMKGIGATASAATMRARRSAEMAMQAGKSWVMKRYAGGKIGSKPPNTSDRLFNDSGRFAESIVAAGAKDGTWRINVAANRLNPQTANGGVEAVQRIWRRLVELVPEFQDVGLIIQQNKLLERTIQNAISKGRKTDGKASPLDVAKAVLKLAKTASDIIAA